MVYRIFGRKLKSKVHAIDPATGKTYCKAENNLQIHFQRDFDKMPSHRRPCSICVSRQAIAEHRPSEPSLAVLMGEAAEVEEHELEVECAVRDMGRFLVIERDGRRWTLGKKYPGFDAALRELTGP